MRKGLIVIMILAILMTGVAGADSSKIKGMTKYINPEHQNSVTFIVETNVDTDDVTANGHPLTRIVNGNDKWKGDIPLTETDEETETVIINAKKNNNGHDEQNMGNGGCPDRNSYDSHNIEYEFAQVNPVPLYGTQTTIFLDTFYRPDAGVIAICIYPEQDYNPLIGQLSQVYDPSTWEIKYNNNNNKDYFGSGRMSGNSQNIPVNGIKNIPIMSSFYGRDTNSGKILMHIFDRNECSKTPNDDDDGIPETCWRKPCTTIIPEFSTIAIPIAAVLGLVFFFQHRKRKEE